MLLEDLLHDRDRFVFMVISNKNSILDGQGNKTFRPESYQDPHKDT